MSTHSADWRRNVYIVAGGVFIAAMGFSIVAPFLPALVTEVGVSSGTAFWSGMVLAVNFVTSSLMAPVWGSIADQVGKRPMMVRAGLGIALTYLFMARARSVWDLVIWRAVNGLLAGYIPAANVLVATNTPDSHLGRALGLLQAASAAGTISGPLIGGVAAQLLGPRGAMLVAAGLLALAGLLPILSGIQERVQPQSPVDWRQVGQRVMLDVREALADPGVSRLFGLQLLFSMAQVMTQPTLPLYVATLVSRDVALVTGMVYSAAGIATAVGAPAASRWGDRDPLALLRCGIVAASLTHAAQGLVPHPLFLAGARLAFGLSASAVVVASGVLLARRTPPEHRGRAFGVLQSVNGAGAVAGPLLGGALGEVAGLAAPFWAGAVVIGVAYWVTLRSAAALRPASAAPVPSREPEGREPSPAGEVDRWAAMTGSTSSAARRSSSAERRSASSSAGASGRSTMRSTPDHPTTHGMPR